MVRRACPLALACHVGCRLGTEGSSLSPTGRRAHACVKTAPTRLGIIASGHTARSFMRPPANLRFLDAPGQVAALMRDHDWRDSPLGPPDAWPQSLRSVVSLLLRSKFPMFVAWGPSLGFLYN